MLRAELLTLETFRAAVARYPHHPGIVLARDIARVADPAAESPGESWLRLRIIDAGFPKAPQADRESATASLRVLYSAAAWVYLADCGFNQQARIHHVQWNTKAVLRELRKLSGGNHA